MQIRPTRESPSRLSHNDHSAPGVEGALRARQPGFVACCAAVSNELHFCFLVEVPDEGTPAW